MKNIANIRASIYYAKKQWHKLLEILPPAFGPYLIFLSVERGDNIRLVIFSNDEEVKANFTDYFKRVLIDQPSAQPEATFKPGTSLWMNYENNSIQLNNFGLPLFTSENDLTLKYCKAISNYIIKNIAQEEITSEYVLNHTIFVVINLIKLFKRSDIVGILDLAINSIITEYELAENAGILSIVENHVLEDYPDNKETIHECYYSDAQEDVYLRDIISNAELIKIKANIGFGEMGWCFYLLINLLNNHLGITPGNGTYILSLLKKYFQESLLN
jgi:hypothetical protein